MRRLLGLGLVAALTIVACLGKDNVGAPPDNNPPANDASTTGDGSSPSNPTPPVPACDERRNKEGCGCALVGSTEPCAVDETACSKVDGLQTCSPTMVWGACSGTPAPTEICFDNVDNNCNAKTDEDCPCSSDFDACKPNGVPLAADETKAYVFTIPKQPRVNEPFDVLVVSRRRLSGQKALLLGTCDPGWSLNIGSCPSAGLACDGWFLHVWHGVKRGVANTYEVKLYENENKAGVPNDGPCKATNVAGLVVTPSSIRVE